MSYYNIVVEKPMLTGIKMPNAVTNYYQNMYGTAYGSVAITNKDNKTPKFINASKFCQNPTGSFEELMLDSTNRKLCLSTFATFGKKNKTNHTAEVSTSENNICNVCAIAVEISRFDEDQRDRYFPKSTKPAKLLDLMKTGKVNLPLPTYMVEGDKTYFLYVFSQPIVISGISDPKKRQSVLNLLNLTAHTIAETISQLDGFFAVPVPLNGFISMPGSYKCIFEREFVPYSKMTPEERRAKFPNKEQAYRRPKENYLFKYKSVNNFSYHSVVMNGCFTMRELTELALPSFDQEAACEKKGEQDRNSLGLKTISIRPSIHSNIHNMLHNRLQFLRVLANDKKRDTYTLCELFWVYANQFYYSRSEAYRAFMSFCTRFHIELSFTEKNKILKRRCKNYHTHAFFLKRLGLSMEQAIARGFVCQTKESEREYQSKYHYIYHRRKMAKKYGLKRDISYDDLMQKWIKKASALSKSGKNVEYIAKKLGKSVRTIYRYLNLASKQECLAA